MSSFESTERHLTPAGWVIGTRVWDGGRKDLTPPLDRVLTVEWYESGTGYLPAVGTERELWRCSDLTLIERLIAQFGLAERDL